MTPCEESKTPAVESQPERRTTPWAKEPARGFWSVETTGASVKLWASCDYGKSPVSFDAREGVEELIVELRRAADRAWPDEESESEEPIDFALGRAVMALPEESEDDERSFGESNQALIDAGIVEY